MIIEVRVKPNAHTSRLEQAEDGTWIARLKSAPVEGRANAELIALIARHFGVRKADVAIAGGAAGRRKRIRISV